MKSWPLPLWIAHRGAGTLAPENTLAAFRAGAAQGYRAFECDVRLSADGVPFLLHDETLERTTSGHGPASALPWSELSRLDAGTWHSHQHAGEPPASLAAVAAYVQHSGFAINLEIKPTPGQGLATGRAVGAAAQALWAGSPRAGWPLLSSFQPEAVDGARRSAPALPRALLLDQLWPGWLDTALALKCRAVVTHHPLMDAALREQLHAHGLRALCFTVNHPAEAGRLLALGVDGLITDRVDRFAPAA